ncbi:MAG: DUF1592 domain-containing protein, partial [Planctomycetales bacterium]|nr:DUF1592 domain-containing protein [Planctomycetales bacterium]
MSGRRALPTVLIAGAMLSLVGPIAVHGADSAKPLGDYRTDVAPFIQKYCAECHGAKSPKADVSLHSIRDAAGVMADKATWESVLEMVEFRAMPPEDKPQPSEEERARVVKWLEATLFHVDCTAGRDPGRVTIQRLNRNEYDNTIRDLFGLDLKLSKNFPSDDVGEGFDNIGDVLSLPPLLMEKYLDAAEAVAQAAILVPGAENAPKLVREGRRLRGTQSASRGDSGFWNMYSSGSVLGEFEAARDGRYLIRIEAMANQAGDEPARMAVRQDQRELQTVDVKAEFDSPEVYEIPLTTKAGSFQIEAAFTNDFYVEGNGNTPTQDRNLYVSRIELIGPLDLDSSALPESHRRIVVSRPEKGKSVRDAASEVLYRFVSRAYRRQATREEVEPFVGLVEAAVKNGESYERGIQIAVAATLVSPQFLFRIEHDPRPNDADTVHALSDYELASRLSYFLWSSMPDTELFSYARAGKLNESETLRRQVKRMLADPKAEALVRNFGGQWLNLRNLDEIQPDPQKFPGVDEMLKQDMRRETEMFFDA